MLREEAVRSAALDGRIEEMAAALHLAPEEVAVAREYASSPAGTAMFVETYRYRMVSSFFNAMETACPLTRRALAARGLDLGEYAARFMDAHEWFDYGPFVFTYGRHILDYLAADEIIDGLPGFGDLIGLEKAAITMIIAAAGPGGPQPPGPGYWRAWPWFEVYRSATDLSGWLRVPGELGRTVPSPVSRQYVVYLPSADAERRIVSLPRRALELLCALRERPMTSDELAALPATGSGGNDVEGDQRCMRRLAALELVAPPTLAPR
jgi:hypothetical protein